MRVQKKWNEVGFWNWVLLSMVLVAFIFGLAVKARADTANSFAVAEFYNPIHFSRTGLVERWTLDPGLSGDHTGGLGDFEIWSGAEGGCEDCSSGFACTCAGTSEIRSESTYLYKTDTSAEVAVDGAGSNAQVCYEHTFAANTCYQVSFCYKGDAGSEDFVVSLENAGAIDFYNFATDAWGGASSLAFNNITTSWVCASTFVRTGVAVKTDYLYCLRENGASQTWYADNFQLRQLDSCDVIGEHTNVVSVVVDGDPVFGESPDLLFKPGAGIATRRGMELDGIDDYLNGGDILSPTEGHLTVACRVLPDTVSTTVTPISQWHSVANQSSYLLNFESANVVWYVDDDGTGATSTSITDAAVLVADTMVSVVATYHQVANGSSEMILGVNNETEVTSAVAVAPIWNSTGDFCIGAAHGGANLVNGEILECSVWHSVLDAVGRNKYHNPYFPATRHGDGFYVHTCSQAASHATCSTQVCRDGTPNACQAEGTGVFAAYGQYTELCDDNLTGTLTGDDSNPTFTHWTETSDAGDGSASLTAYRVDVYAGDVSARMTLTGTTSWLQLTSACETTGIGSDIYVEATAKKLSGTADLYVIVGEYSSVDCTTGFLSSTTLYSGDVSSVWDQYGDVLTTWDGSTSSYQVRVLSYQSASDVLVGAVSIKVAAYHTPLIPNVGAGSTTANARDCRLANPLAAWSDTLGEYMYESGFCASVWVYNDWDAEDGVNHILLYAPTTAGNNNRWHSEKADNNLLYFTVYDSVGDARLITLAVTNTNWTASNWKYVEMCSNNTDSTIVGHFYNVANATWYNLGGIAGGGTGIQDGQNTEFHVGHSIGGSFLNGYISRINIGPYNAIWPLEGFNDGRPPVNEGSPY